MNYDTNNNCLCKNDCIACGNNTLFHVLDLGTQPLANSFKKNKDDDESCYPLSVNFCVTCSHLQLSHLVHQDELFKNYVYVSGTSKTQLDYFEWFANMVSSTIGKVDGLVLDIGCNDGSQLNVFKKLGFQTYGVDPAKNLYHISSKNHNIVCDYFNTEQVIFDKKFDCIVCQNAFAHNYNQFEFLKKCKTILSDDGKIFISISQATMIQNDEFDTIYHEHYSYYNVKSMDTLCKRAGLFLVDVLQHDIHGDTYIFVLSKTNNRLPIVDDMIFKETQIGMSDINTYLSYANKASRIANKFREIIDNLKSRGYLIVGYGSPAKGNTMLNFSGVTLDCIIDDNPLKQGTFTPGTSIPVVSGQSLMNLKSDDPVCFVPLAWNFFDEIHKKISVMRNNKPTIYVKYFPEFCVFTENFPKYNGITMSF